jgi:outer membrane protein assembly factor BamB
MHARRRRRLIAAAAAIVVVAGGAGIAYAVLKSRTGDIFHSNVEFRPEQTKGGRAGSWPVYGYTPDHLRYLAAPIEPPFRKLWWFPAHGLLEFPPVVDGGVLYQLNDNAVLNAVDTADGHLRWQRTLGTQSAATPAVGGGVVYATVMKRPGVAHGGSVTAMSARDGHVIWQRALPSPSESSPLLYAGTLYFGSQDSTVYALDARTGATRWTLKASGSVKGSPAASDGVLYFGDYGGDVRAVSARTGAQIWKASTSGALLGAGTFYAAPAVAFGRLYIGNTDGRMYSFALHTGKLAWARQTGNYVYASAAMLDTPGVGPTAYVGSYDGVMYAFDARTGATRWKYDAHGKISGSATIVGRILYFANLAKHSTTGLDVRTGTPVYSTNQGSFDPVVSDGRRIYLTGYTSVTAYEPVRR